MGQMKVPAAPRGLGAPGRRLWKSVMGEFEPDAAESRILAQACATADELDRIKAELDQSPVTSVGSTGQPKAHPLFAEVRAHRAQLVALLGKLDLVGAEESDGSTSVKAITAARARWGQGRVVG